MTPDQDEFRRRAIRAALTVAGIAVVLGLLIGGVTASVVNLTGLVPDEPARSALPTPGVGDNDDLPTPSLLPTNTPSPRASASPSAKQTSGVADKPSTKPTHKPPKKPKHRTASSIRLSASDASVSAYDEVTLSGSYPGGSGTTLQVQRLEGGSWTAFPTTATVDGGRFSTFVASGQSGVNKFRVVDPDSGVASNAVSFRVS